MLVVAFTVWCQGCWGHELQLLVLGSSHRPVLTGPGLYDFWVFGYKAVNVVYAAFPEILQVPNILICGNSPYGCVALFLKMELAYTHIVHSSFLYKALC